MASLVQGGNVPVPRAPSLQIVSDREFGLLMISAPRSLCAAASRLAVPRSLSGRDKVISPIWAKHPAAAAAALPIVSRPWGRKGESEQMGKSLPD